MHPNLEKELRLQPRVLDVGGWFKPMIAATHVIDLLPYETRYGGGLQTSPLPGERFSKATWSQCDFLNPDLRLPFATGHFDFAYCGHTIEDLADPRPLLREMSRVARAGEIRCPSRLSEQSRGVRDRMSASPGHSHHHWIVDAPAGRLRLCAKTDSLVRRASLLPLAHYERTTRQKPGEAEISYRWTRQIDCETVRGADAARIAEQFARARQVCAWDRYTDGPVRGLRRLRYWRKPNNKADTTQWWRGVLAASRPYSTIPLPE